MKKVKFKSGAASFYMVAFSTLLLVIIATSFALVIVANVARSSNDDLSQSAYDAAMAGVEDALLAYKTYMDCRASGASSDGTLAAGDVVTCEDILYWVEHPDCFMTARILGRIDKNGDGREVAIGDSTMNQAYTCVKFQQDDESYAAKLEPELPESTVKVEFDEASAMKNVAKLTMRWGGASDDESAGGAVAFGKGMIGETRFRFPTYGVLSERGTQNVLPIVSLRVLQVAASPSFEDVFAATDDSGRTNRAMAYFVPVEGDSSGVKGAVWLGDGNSLTAEAFAATNRGNTAGSENLPFLVKCDNGSGKEYPCEVTVELPEPIKGGRAELVVSIASVYGNAGEVTIEFSDADGRLISVKNGNAIVDSTGRAGDRYRRIRAKLQSDNVMSSGITSALYLHQGASVIKDTIVGM